MNAVPSKFDASFTPVSTLGPYRAADYFALPGGIDVELIRGSLAPKNGHIAPHPFSSKSVYLATKRVLTANLKRAVTPTDRDRRSLLVEVHSGNERRPRCERIAKYARLGVQEYWLVDPIEQYVWFCVLEGAAYRIFTGVDGHYQSPRLPEVQIDLAAFWREVGEQLPHV